MGLFGGAFAQIDGKKAYNTHLAANRLAKEGKPREAAAKYEQAYALYERAIAAGGQKPGILLGFAVLLMRMGEFDRAMELMQSMRTMKDMTDDDWFDLRLNYAVCLWKKGRLDEAAATIGRAADYKKNAMIYTTMGMILVDQAKLSGDFSAAEAFNREAMDYDDEDAGTLDNMGAMEEAKADIARAAGDMEAARDHRAKALKYYEKAHENNPRQITTIHALARLCHEDGRDDRAREAMEDIDTLYYSAVCPVTREMMEKLRREIG